MRSAGSTGKPELEGALAWAAGLGLARRHRLHTPHDVGLVETCVYFGSALQLLHRVQARRFPAGCLAVGALCAVGVRVAGALEPAQRADFLPVRRADEGEDESGAAPEVDAVGDGVGQRHQDDREERGQRDLALFPVDVRDAAYHEGPDQDQHARGRQPGHSAEERGEEERQEQQCGCRHCRQSSPPS
eukprot:2162660-Rhodomonas_salina.1